MKKLLLKILPFALACCLFAASAGINASADNTPTRGTDVEDIVISGVKILDTREAEGASKDGNSANRTYYHAVQIAPGNNQTVTIDFIKAAGSNCVISSQPGSNNNRSAILNNQALSYSRYFNVIWTVIKVYVYPDVDSDPTRFDTYVFDFTRMNLDKFCSSDENFPHSYREDDGRRVQLWNYVVHDGDYITLSFDFSSSTW